MLQCNCTPTCLSLVVHLHVVVLPQPVLQLAEYQRVGHGNLHQNFGLLMYILRCGSISSGGSVSQSCEVCEISHLSTSWSCLEMSTELKICVVTVYHPSYQGPGITVWPPSRTNKPEPLSRILHKNDIWCKIFNPIILSFSWWLSWKTSPNCLMFLQIHHRSCLIPLHNSVMFLWCSAGLPYWLPAVAGRRRRSSGPEDTRAALDSVDMWTLHYIHE